MTLRYNAELDDMLPVQPKRELSDIPQQMWREDRLSHKGFPACLRCGHDGSAIGSTGRCDRCHPIHRGWRGHPAGAPVPYYGASWIPPVGSERRIGG